MQIHENTSLAELTTFQIGGTARYFVEVSSEAEIRDALGWAREKDVPFFVIAGGSNLLLPDSSLEGLVIRLVGERFSIAENILQAEAGRHLLALLRASAEQRLGG